MSLANIKPLTMAKALAAKVSDPDYVLGPLQPGDIGILSGADGSGKSLVALSMGAGVAYGVPACGVVDAPQHAGRVLYIAGEDRRDDHIRRLKRLGEHLRVDYRIAVGEEDRLTIWPLLGKRMPLVEKNGNGFSITPFGKMFAGAISIYRLVILDPLRMFHNLDESDGPGMDFFGRWLVTIAMQNQQVILLVHHASQGAILEGRSDHHVGRGATDLPAVCRSAWTLRAMNQKEAKDFNISDDERRDWRILANGKASHVAEGSPRWLQRRGGLWVMGSHTPVKLAHVDNDWKQSRSTPDKYGLRPIQDGSANDKES